MRHICKMEKLEIRVVTSTFVRKEIHEELMKTLGKESPSYSTVKHWAAEFRRGRER